MRLFKPKKEVVSDCKSVNLENFSYASHSYSLQLTSIPTLMKLKKFHLKYCTMCKHL